MSCSHLLHGICISFFAPQTNAAKISDGAWQPKTWSENILIYLMKDQIHVYAVPLFYPLTICHMWIKQMRITEKNWWKVICEKFCTILKSTQITVKINVFQILIYHHNSLHDWKGIATNLKSVNIVVFSIVCFKMRSTELISRALSSLLPLLNSSPFS